MVEVQNERKWKSKETGKVSFVRPIYIKDLDGTKMRVGIWRNLEDNSRSPGNVKFVEGHVYSFLKLKVDKWPKAKPHFLQTGYGTQVKVCSDATKEKFKDIVKCDGNLFIYLSFERKYTSFNKIRNRDWR